MISYQTAQSADIPAIAEFYQQAFPEALEAVFGRPRIPALAVKDVFMFIYEYEPAGVIVAKYEQELAGYFVVVSNSTAFQRYFLRHGPLYKLIFRFLTLQYWGLGLGFIPRLLKAAWDYRMSGGKTSSQALAQVLSIVVGKTWRRQGIGQTLSNKGLDYLRSKEISAVRLEVLAEKIEAVSLYKKLGFREEGRMPSPCGPALIMTLAL